MLINQKSSASTSKRKVTISIFGGDSKEEIQLGKTQKNLSNLDLENEVGRIRRTLQETLVKLETMFRLPAMIKKKPELLTDYLGQEQTEFVLMILPPEEEPEIRSLNPLADSRMGVVYTFSDSVSKFTDSDFFGAYNEASKRNERKEGQMDKRMSEVSGYGRKISETASSHRTTYHVKINAEPVVADFIRVVDIVMKCKGLTEILLKNYEIDENRIEGRMTAAMKKLLGFVDDLTQTTERRKKEKKLATCYNFGLVLDDNITELENSNSKFTSDFKMKEREKLSVITEYNTKLDNLRQSHRLRTQKTVVDSESDIERWVARSEEQQEKLKSSAESSALEYESLMQNNLKEEKDLQNKLKKVEVQYAAWVSKYDNDIGERQNDIDRLAGDNETIVKELVELQELFDNQEDVYLPLMAEKAEEERIEFEAVLYKFVCNRAARIVQRAWKAYKIRKLERKKNRKGKMTSKSQKNFDKDEHARITADVEFHIQADYLRKIMEDVLTKLRILINVPSLLQEEGVEVMRTYLGDANTDFILLVCKEYSNSIIFQDFTASFDISHISCPLHKISVFNNEEKPTVDPSELESFRISQVAHFIMESKELRNYLEDRGVTDDVVEKKFLWCFETLQKILLDSLKKTGIEQKQHDAKLRDSYRNYLILAANIRDLECELEQQVAELKESHKNRLGVMFGLERQVSVLKDEYNEKVKKLVYESEKAMMRAFNVSEERQDVMSARMQEDTQQYDTMLANDLKEETLLRARKLKIETQLASWVAKYDQDIGERQAELERLEEMYNKEKQQLEQLEVEFEDQAQEYDFLMAEKEAEERRMLEEMLLKFVRNRAARIIQRNWRAYIKRRASKKKKKGKKGSEKKGSAKGKGKDKKKDKASEYVKGIEKREKEKQDSAKEKEKTLEQKFGDDMFQGVKDDDPSAFQNKEKDIRLSEI